jgi:hypothetical protein
LFFISRNNFVAAEDTVVVFFKIRKIENFFLL